MNQSDLSNCTSIICRIVDFNKTIRGLIGAGLESTDSSGLWCSGRTDGCCAGENLSQRNQSASNTCSTRIDRCLMNSHRDTNTSHWSEMNCCDTRSNVCTESSKTNTWCICARYIIIQHLSIFQDIYLRSILVYN